MNENLNPFDKIKEEGKYLAYNHGFTSESKNDCPYSENTLEYDNFISAWMQGYNAGSKNRKKEIKKGASQQSETPTETKELTTMTDEDLIKELRKRKQNQYNQLLKQKEEIDKQLTKLRFLFDE